jgi:hypothetical protein
VIVVRTGKDGGSWGWGVLDVRVAWRRAKKEGEKLASLSVEELFKADENNFAILNSEIEKVRLKKYGLGAVINITTGEKKHNWPARGIPMKKGAKIEDMRTYYDPFFQANCLFQKSCLQI